MGTHRIQPRSARFELVTSKEASTPVPRLLLSVLLAGPAPSGSADTSRRCQGRLPPSPAPPGSGCPQLHRSAATERRRRALTPTQSKSASRRPPPSRHPFRIQRQHDLVDLGQPALPLLHDLRLERSL